MPPSTGGVARWCSTVTTSGGALGLARRARSRIREDVGLQVLQDELLAAESSHDLDELHLLVQVDSWGISGYEAADWLREHERIDVHLGNAQRIEVQITVANTEGDIDRLVGALTRLRGACARFEPPPDVRLPEPGALELEQAMSPREAFFGRTEDVAVPDAVGRIAAEQITPYPPGIPVMLPGERIGQAAVDYLVSGRRAGMFLPDAVDDDLGTIRSVVGAH